MRSRITGEKVDESSPVCTFLSFFLSFLLSSKAEMACTHNVTLLGQDQSTLAQRAEMTVDKRSLTSCV